MRSGVDPTTDWQDNLCEVQPPIQQCLPHLVSSSLWGSLIHLVLDDKLLAYLVCVVLHIYSLMLEVTTLNIAEGQLIQILYVVNLRFWKGAVAAKILQYSAGQSSVIVQSEVWRCVLHIPCVLHFVLTLIQAQPRLYSCLAILSSPSPDHVNYTVSGTLYFQ